MLVSRVHSKQENERKIIMPKVKHGDYGAFTTAQGGLRFQFQNKLIKEVEVPEPIKEALKQALGIDTSQIVPPSRFEQATAPEEQAKVVDTPAQRDDEGNVLQEAPLNPEDFAPSANPAPLTEGVEVAQPQEFNVLEPSYEEAVGQVSEALSTLEEVKQTVSESASVLEEFLKTVTIEDLANLMFDKFGVYTIWLKRYPEDNEISPFTGEPMPSYERGLAYQAAKRAFMQGRLERINYTGLREAKMIADEQGRAIRESYNIPAPLPTPEQDEAQNNFDFRTSVKAANQTEPQMAPLIHVEDANTGQMVVIRDPNWTPEPKNLNGAQSVRHPGESEPLVAPPLNQLPGNAIIRPNW